MDAAARLEDEQVDEQHDQKDPEKREDNVVDHAPKVAKKRTTRL